MSRVQKWTAAKFMYTTIHNHIKKSYIKKGIHPTVEQVMQDINEGSLNSLPLYFTVEEIEEKVEESIRRQKCKE